LFDGLLTEGLEQVTVSLRGWADETTEYLAFADD
jgi:hypothetical protein